MTDYIIDMDKLKKERQEREAAAKANYNALIERSNKERAKRAEMYAALNQFAEIENEKAKARQAADECIAAEKEAKREEDLEKAFKDMAARYGK